jgi:copper homeostasis protein
MSHCVLEACVETVEAALAAEAGGAHRIELGVQLDLGGTTPPAGLIYAAVARLGIPLFVLIRPRAGDFVYHKAELETMRHQVAVARALGAGGVVIGGVTATGEVDDTLVAELRRTATPLPVTFHRAFDVVREPRVALERLISLGVERVLTSGQAPTAVEGAELLAALVRHAESRIGIVAAGGVRAHNVGELVRRTRVTEVHSRTPVNADQVREMVEQLRAAT